MNKTYLTHAGDELNEAVTKFQDSLVPTGTLPAQVILHAVCNPISPTVILNWQFRDENATGIVIRRKKDELPINAYDGEAVCDIKGTETTTFIDENYTSDTGTIELPAVYKYRAFPYNENRQYQTQYQTSIEMGVSQVNVYYLHDGAVLGDIEPGTLLNLPLYFGRWGSSDSVVKELLWSIVHVDTVNRLAYIMASYPITSMMFDNSEAKNPDTTRASGNARWSVSNIRQWLQTDKAAKEWYESQHDYDVAPNYTSYPGFLYYFTEAEKNLIVPRQNTLSLCSNDGGGTESVVDTVWLPSTRDVNGTTSTTEGELVFKAFTDNASRRFATDYWLRTIYSSNTPYRVTSSGSVGGNIANNISYSARAGLVLPLDTLIQYDTESETYKVVNLI